MSLDRMDHYISLERSDSAPNLIERNKEFSPYKKTSPEHYGDDFDDEALEIAQNILYKHHVPRRSYNPFHGLSKIIRGPGSLARETGKVFGAISQFFPRRRKGTGRRSRKQKKKRKKKTRRKKKKNTRKQFGGGEVPCPKYPVDDLKNLQHQKAYIFKATYHAILNPYTTPATDTAPEIPPHLIQNWAPIGKRMRKKCRKGYFVSVHEEDDTVYFADDDAFPMVNLWRVVPASKKIWETSPDIIQKGLHIMPGAGRRRKMKKKTKKK